MIFSIRDPLHLNQPLGIPWGIAPEGPHPSAFPTLTTFHSPTNSADEQMARNEWRALGKKLNYVLEKKNVFLKGKRTYYMDFEETRLFL